jgi:HSP20 family protein
MSRHKCVCVPGCFITKRNPQPYFILYLIKITMLQFSNHLQHNPFTSRDHFRASGRHIGALLHQAPMLFLDTIREKHDLCPVFDVRETAEAYFLEGEFPGISGAHAIKVEWLDGNSLRVTGHIYKTDLEVDWAADRLHRTSPRLWQATVEDQACGTAVQSASENAFLPLCRFDNEVNKDSAPKENTPKEWLSERGIGAFVRTFDFPSAVDTSGIRVKLYQGLLRMMVPKEDPKASKTKEIAIESGEQAHEDVEARRVQDRRFDEVL